MSGSPGRLDRSRRWFRRRYGSTPRHLTLLLAGFALAGAAVLTLGLDQLGATGAWWQSIAVWFVGAVLLHDLVLFPLVAGADHGLHRVLPAPVDDGPSLLNHVRLALLACGLVSLLFFPGVLRRGADSYRTATGMSQDPFLLRWILLCAGILLLSAALYVVRRRRAARTGSRPAGRPASVRSAEVEADDAGHDEQQ